MTSMWQQYKALAPRTRMYIGVGGMVFAMAGLYISDAMEERLDPARRQEIAKETTSATATPDGSIAK
ncbi:hypothetical protein BG011_000316 [Mortierella polycephala]|uniref:Uncharacterized protein n=1 Tax=Mortierella polycephala TaxID=41804 RepID=A0A9P6Q894_9FUNG|nr:hypothetical protein BG011_000316 [Mortierella polycephala]